jgi:hypothetical protein
MLVHVLLTYPDWRDHAYSKLQKPAQKSSIGGSNLVVRLRFTWRREANVHADRGDQDTWHFDVEGHHNA